MQIRFNLKAVDDPIWRLYGMKNMIACHLQFTQLVPLEQNHTYEMVR